MFTCRDRRIYRERVPLPDWVIAAAAAYMLLSLILGVAAVFAAEALMHM